MGTGCIATTMDITHLQESIDSIQKTQANLISKMDQLDHSLVKFREELLITQKKFSYFSENIEDAQSGVHQRLTQISDLLTATTNQNSAPLPSAYYKAAYGDYLAGNLDLAIDGFENFIERYPKSVLVPHAHFFIGESYLAKKDFNLSRLSFDKVLSISQELRLQTLLKRSYALAGLENVENQKLTLETLIKEFPDSKESEIAKDMLKELSEKLTPPPTKEKIKSTPIQKKKVS